MRRPKDVCLLAMYGVGEDNTTHEKRKERMRIGERKREDDRIQKLLECDVKVNRRPEFFTPLLPEKSLRLLHLWTAFSLCLHHLKYTDANSEVHMDNEAYLFPHAIHLPHTDSCNRLRFHLKREKMTF